MMKEAIDDLEWPGGPVEIVMRKNPNQLMLCSAGTGSLEVRIASGPHVQAQNRELRLFRCSVLGGVSVQSSESLDIVGIYPSRPESGPEFRNRAGEKWSETPRQGHTVDVFTDT